MKLKQKHFGEQQDHFQSSSCVKVLFGPILKLGAAPHHSGLQGEGGVKSDWRCSFIGFWAFTQMELFVLSGQFNDSSHESRDATSIGVACVRACVCGEMSACRRVC